MAKKEAMQADKISEKSDFEKYGDDLSKIFEGELSRETIRKVLSGARVLKPARRYRFNDALNELKTKEAINEAFLRKLKHKYGNGLPDDGNDNN